MEKETASELKNQWEDLVLAGVIRTVFNTFSKEIIDGFKNGTASVADSKKLEDYIAGQAEKKLSPLSNDFKSTMTAFLVSSAMV